MSQALAEVAPQLQGELSAITAHVEELARLEESAGDRWAVVLEAARLVHAGWPSWRIARALITAGAYPGTRSSQSIQRCEAWLRQERARFRAARDASRGRVTLKSADGLNASNGAGTFDLIADGPRGGETMPRLVKRERVIETYEVDEAELPDEADESFDEPDDEPEVEDEKPKKRGRK